MADFYENVAARVGEPIAIQLMACYEGEGGPERVKNATLALAELSEEDRQILYDCGIIGSITEDGWLSDEELAYLADVDRDGLPNPEDELDLNPLNDGERSHAARLYVAKAGWFLFSCPRYGPTFLMGDVYGLEGVELLLDALDEGAIIAEDFSPRECHIGFLMASYPHTRELVANSTLRFLFVPAVKQIDASVYPYVVLQAAEHRSPEECRESERYAWEMGIDPAIAHVIDWIKDGDVNLSFLKKNCTDIERGMVVFPTSLPYYDMEKMEPVHDGLPHLQLLIINVNPSERYQGKTPWEHWHDVAKQGFADPGFRERCFEEARCANTYLNWPILERSFLEVLDNVTARDPLCVYLMGFPYEIGVGEQNVEFFGPHLATSFGRPAWGVVVPYDEEFAHGFFAVKSTVLPPSGNNKGGYYYQGWNGTAWEREFGDWSNPPKHPPLPPPIYGEFMTHSELASCSSKNVSKQTSKLTPQIKPADILNTFDNLNSLPTLLGVKGRAWRPYNHPAGGAQVLRLRRRRCIRARSIWQIRNIEIG